jgi:hypothetical protein
MWQLRLYLLFLRRVVQLAVPFPSQICLNTHKLLRDRNPGKIQIWLWNVNTEVATIQLEPANRILK